MASLLLGENGIDASSGATFVDAGGFDAVRQLRLGQVDAAFFVTSPQSKLIRELIVMENVRLLNFDRHAAYARRHPFLTSVTLERGIVDLQRDFIRVDALRLTYAGKL